jgi:hypothetical protein
MFRSTFLASSHYAGKWIIPDEALQNLQKLCFLCGRVWSCRVCVTEGIHGRKLSRLSHEISVHDHQGYDPAGE